jgi:mRNA interferase HicA
MIVRLAGEIECKGIRDQKNTPVEVRGFPGPKSGTWGTQSFWDGRRWATRQLEFACINNIAYAWDVNSNELKRWLAKQGVEFGTQTGSHLKAFYEGRQTILPMHGKSELPKGLVADIKKQLGIKDKE